MSVKECIEKLVISGQVARKTADDALALYDRMNNRYSAQAGPAAAEAAAALATARALRQGAAEKAARIANDVRAFTDAEARVLEHPYGRKAGLMALMTKDMWRGGGLMRDAPIENRIARGIAFMTLSTAAGAVSLQAAAIAAGKDPLDMGSAKFWTQAYIKGGAGGLYGDLLAAGIRGDRSAADVAAEFTGPLPGLAADAFRLAGAPVRAELDDSGRPKKPTLGRELINLGKRNTPNTFYTKLAIDRLWWDKLQILVDPDYRGSFRRANQAAKKQGPGFWWAPGATSPGH